MASTIQLWLILHPKAIRYLHEEYDIKDICDNAFWEAEVPNTPPNHDFGLLHWCPFGDDNWAFSTGMCLGLKIQPGSLHPEPAPQSLSAGQHQSCSDLSRSSSLHPAPCKQLLRTAAVFPSCSHQLLCPTRKLQTVTYKPRGKSGLLSYREMGMYSWTLSLQTQT